jgi:predicted SprT family Zn-dependent metalloprotease
VEVWRQLYVAFWCLSSEDAGMPRKNARIDAFVLDALGFDGPRENPRRRAPRAPRPSAPYHPSADPWAVQRAVIAEHRMHAAAARQQARYDADALETAEYHDAEAERLEAELAAGRGRKKRKNPAPDSEAFRRWFGESKVVDAAGKPLVVYHGTEKGGFYAFDMGQANKEKRPGTMFFTDDIGMARSYTRGSGDPTPPYFESVEEFLEYVKTDDSPWTVETEYYAFSDEDETRYADLDALREARDDLADDDIVAVYKVWNPDGYKAGTYDSASDTDMEELLSVVNSESVKKAGVYAVYLRIVDPLVVDAEGASWDSIPREGEDEDGNPVNWTYTTNELAREARDLECDGLIIRDVSDPGEYGQGGESGDVFVVFNGKQIKSAKHNVGTFDPATDDIRRNSSSRRRNPTRAAYAHDADFDEVDDWVTIEECACHSCAPARMNPPKRKATGAYADLDSIILVTTNALAKHGLTMQNVEVKFTRGGKSRAGACSYSPSLRKCKIMFNGLAWPAFTEEQRLNTVLHEAAHAIEFLTTGRSGHGPRWQSIARSIGCTGDRCMSVEASQAMVDAYSEAKGLPKRKVIPRRGRCAPARSRWPAAADADAAARLGPVVDTEEWDDGTVVEFVAVPFPVERKPLSYKDDPKVSGFVRVEDLIATQRRVTKAGVEKYLDDLAGRVGRAEKIRVYQTQDGRQYIADGHHRAVAAWAAGVEVLPAVIQLVRENPTADLRSNPDVRRPRPRAREEDMLDAIQHADVYGDQGWTLDDFTILPMGEVPLSRVLGYEDCAWIDVDPEDFAGMSAEERLTELSSFRGPKWAARAAEWLSEGVPPIVVIDAPVVDEAHLYRQIGDGRGRVNFALAMGLKTLPVVIMKWKHPL